MAILYTSKYQINTQTPEGRAHFDAIKKYDRGSIKKINQNPVNKRTTWADIDQILTHQQTIEIECGYKNSDSLIGLWPKLPMHLVSLPESYTKNFNRISDYIHSILGQHAGPAVQEFAWGLPKLDSIEMDPEFVMHAINMRFPVSGAIKLDNVKKIIFEINEEQFVLDYATVPLKFYHGINLNFDIDDGFISSDSEIANTLNQTHFMPFKQRNYSGDLALNTDIRNPEIDLPANLPPQLCEKLADLQAALAAERSAQLQAHANHTERSNLVQIVELTQEFIDQVVAPFLRPDFIMSETTILNAEQAMTTYRSTLESLRSTTGSKVFVSGMVFLGIVAGIVLGFTLGFGLDAVISGGIDNIAPAFKHLFDAISTIPGIGTIIGCTVGTGLGCAGAYALAKFGLFRCAPDPILVASDDMLSIVEECNRPRVIT